MSMSKSTEILNAFRNKYYTDGNNTENGIVANALNKILPEYIRLKKNEVICGCPLSRCSPCKNEREVDIFEEIHRPHCGARMEDK